MNSRRILKEVQLIKGLDSTQFRVHVGADMTSWRVLIRGPADTPYKDGVFDLSVNFPATFPHNPPDIVFTTRIWHPNVNPDGDICMSRLKKNVEDGWDLRQTMGPMMTSIQMLLANPNPSDPLNGEAAHQYETDRDAYNTKASEMTESFAYGLDVLDRTKPMPEPKTYSRTDLVRSTRSDLAPPLPPGPPPPMPGPPPGPPPPGTTSSTRSHLVSVTNPFFLAGSARSAAAPTSVPASASTDLSGVSSWSTVEPDNSDI